MKVMFFTVSTWKRPEIQSVQSPWVPRATKNSAHVTTTSVYQENTQYLTSIIKLRTEMEVQIPSFQPSTSQALFVPPMFMTYVEGSKMDWTVNGGLYHRFLKWKLKCENILDCEIVMLTDSKKCKKVIAWSGDFWDGSICFLVLAHGRPLVGYYMVQI